MKMLIFAVFVSFTILYFNIFYNLNKAMVMPKNTYHLNSNNINIFDKIKQVTIYFDNDDSEVGVLYVDVKTIKIEKIKNKYSKQEEYILKLEVMKLNNEIH